MLLAVVALGLASSPPGPEQDSLTVSDARVTPDGASVVVALARGHDGVLLHLEIATGKALRAICFVPPAQAVAIDSQGRHIALLSKAERSRSGRSKAPMPFAYSRSRRQSQPGRRGPPSM